MRRELKNKEYVIYYKKMEVIDIGVENLEPISINLSNSDLNTTQQSVNFGSGIELLMNDKKRSSSNNVNIDLGDLNDLENELNELSGNPAQNGSGGETKKLNGFSNFFGFGSTPAASAKPSQNDSNLGQASKESIGNQKTWDGFSKVNDLPQNTGKSSVNMNEREKRRKKRMMIKKLEEWYEKGLVKNITHFNLDSDFDEIEDEYETALEDKRKKDGVKLQGWWFMTFVNSLEYANSAFNPFDLNLDGWGEQVSEDIDSYEEIFGELHEKYKGGKLAPELSLLLRLGFSAAVVNFTNKALSTATPGFSDVIKQSPDLMRMFTNATVENMSQKSPGFAFASNLVSNPDSINTAFGPPPPPVETKNQVPPKRPGMQFTPSVRPDLNMARGQTPMFREQGVDVNNVYVDVNAQERSSRPTTRQEMRGPQTTDIDGLLTGLKTHVPEVFQPESHNVILEDDSLISINSLKDIQNTNLPKRTNRRKQKSDKNTISLDI
jgi:hypothetical protein